MIVYVYSIYDSISIVLKKKTNTLLESVLVVFEMHLKNNFRPVFVILNICSEL